jgi:NTE family protein
MGTAAKALVLQGGGALGAYQAGVCEALLESDGTLDWVAGVSIGAINAALIAGNPPGQRVARLREFWELVSSGPCQSVPMEWGDRGAMNQFSAMAGAMLGIPGFFRPRLAPSLWLGFAAPVLSYYDTSPLRSTLERLVDFERINRREMRLSVGAVDVRSGNSIYFDNTVQKIGVDHIMASGALPPGFPPVHIDGHDYWDGGIVSNTPLQYVLDAYPRAQRLVVLQVDLFSARGGMPATLSEVEARQKDIVYSSRTRMNTDALGGNVNLQQALADLIQKLPARLREDPNIEAVRAAMTHQAIDVVHLIYRNKAYEADCKDYEFSRAAVTEHWEAGARDMRSTIAHPEWLQSSSSANGVTTFDLTDPGAGRVRRPALPAIAPQ